MEFDKLNLDLDKLTLLPNGGDENLEDPETWLFTPTGESEEQKMARKMEEEKLEKWLRGAVEKVDIRTRTALSRRLEKKKRKADKERKRNNNKESSLSMIEELSGESGPLSDREQTKRPREKERMAQRKAFSEASVDSNDDYEEDEEEDDEEYFDAPSTPKKGGTPFGGARNAGTTPQQSPRKMRPNGGAQTLPRGAGGLAGLVAAARSAGTTLPRNARTLQKSGATKEIETEPKEWRNFSDIERRAREQEKELQMELMRHRKERLGIGDRAEKMPRSRPDSASSSSSVLSGGPPASSPAPTMAISKSVDFRNSAPSCNSADQSSVTSSRSNEGSLADLSTASASDCLSQPLNSRLPIPRRPTIPGKTGIPLPTSKRQLNKSGSMQKQSDEDNGVNVHHLPPADPSPFNDDDCF